MISTIDNWEYGKWIQIIGRSLRFNEGTTDEKSAATTFVNSEVNTYRTWLEAEYYKKSNPTGVTNNYQFNARMIEEIGRDIMKTGIATDAEKTVCDALITATGDRYLGDQGNIGGSDVTLP
jgi:hypothetical protein